MQYGFFTSYSAFNQLFPLFKSINVKSNFYSKYGKTGNILKNCTYIELIKRIRNDKMSTYSGILWIVGALAAVLMVGAFRKHVELIINFVLRGVLGMMMIYFVNYFLSGRIPEIEIGYNLLTFCTTGLLGIPGVLMLYGINFYMVL